MDVYSRFPGPTLGDVGEAAAIRELLAAAPSGLNGDDAAVLGVLAPSSRPVITTDALVSGRHFRIDWSEPEEVGIKAVTQNVADIEAMGARPHALVLSLSAPPETPVAVARGIAAGIASEAAEYSAQLVGGDLTTSRDLVLGVSALGALGGALPALTLSGARPGQRLIASGATGRSAAGLALIERLGRNAAEEAFPGLVAAHVAPRLRPNRGIVARAAGASAATDVSDGLVADLSTLAERSGVRVDLEAAAIAPSEEMRAAADELGEDAWRWALTGGEDHVIVAALEGPAPSGFREIGRVGRGSGVTVDGRAPRYAGGWLSL
ncbi:thiamine-phosphate kinase [Corynebacterium otitidis]|uniref:thiamine-phosphate kinase n=1 Tax=Corynebacterium otitidis TaxID=29321 RepID=UPI000627F2A6|nr:thiamine-phosphate kinase [Corynebacterium otitidis]KKO84151.1 thiamine monophosphate kinase [Corynebacterium otitidis]